MISKSNFVIIFVSIVISFQAATAKPAHSNSVKRPAKVTAEDRAIDLVDKQKDVQSWKKLFGPKYFNPATNGRPAFAVEEHHGSIYTVQVFEDMPDHIVTFARYEVNLKTGRVKKVD